MGMCQVDWQRVPDAVPRCHINVLSQDRRWATFVGLPLEASFSGMSMEHPFHEGSAGQDFQSLQHCLNFFCINSKAKLIALINVECRVHPSISSFFLLFLFSYWSLLPQWSLWAVGTILWSWKITVTFLHPWRHSQQSANVKKGWHLPKSVDISVQVMTHTLKV